MCNLPPRCVGARQKMPLLFVIICVTSVNYRDFFVFGYSLLAVCHESTTDIELSSHSAYAVLLLCFCFFVLFTPEFMIVLCLILHI